jgi:hypothetical protein
MSPQVAPANSVLLLVGREQFTPPRTFGGAACAASHDCLAVGVRSVDDGPTSAYLGPGTDTPRLLSLGEFLLESEGFLSLRDVYNREYDAVGVPAGTVRVTVLGDEASEPGEVFFRVDGEV